jgi:peptidoglycan hydrolase-like protein with peptidoglycan-binding domain
MENRVLNFAEFSSLYESYGLYEAEEATTAPDFTPQKTQVSKNDFDMIFGTTEVTEAETVSPFSPMKMGEKSERIKFLQQELGFPSAQQDGDFGPATQKAVKAFQSKNKISVDGIVGDQTLKKMLELKGEKNPEQVIMKKFKVTNPKQAQQAGINPELLKLYDVTIVNNGKQQYIILVPKKGSAEAAKVLKSKGAFKGFEWLAEGVKYLGKALVYTATGVTLVTLEAAKAMISGIASASKFVAGGLIYAMGAVVQGIVQIGKWAAAKGSQIYSKVASAADAVWGEFCKGFALVAKGSVEAFTSFMNGVKAVGYTLTGITLTAWKAVSNALSPAVKALVQGAKDGAQLIKDGYSWIEKNVKAGLQSVKKGVEDGWNTVSKATSKAWDGAKSAAKASGEAVYKAAEEGYTSTMNFMSDMYEKGKKAWESSLTDLYGEEYLYESLISSLENVEFSLTD